MNNIPTQALAVGIPVGLLLVTHLKSLPLAYTVRSWFLLRALIRRAKENKMKPDRMYLFFGSERDKHPKVVLI